MVLSGVPAFGAHAQAADTDPAPVPAATAARPDSCWPALPAARSTYVRQHQTALDSPEGGRLSLGPGGDSRATNTIGFYGGWGIARWARLHLDSEKFMGAGVSGATAPVRFYAIRAHLDYWDLENTRS